MNNLFYGYSETNAPTIINTTFKFRRGSSKDWHDVNPILAEGEPGVETDTLKLKIGNGVLAWRDLPYLTGAPSEPESIFIYNAILTVEDLPEIGSEESLYKIASTQKLYYWDSNKGEFICLNYEFVDTDTNTDNIVIVENLPEIGEENLLYKLPDQSFHYWNSNTHSFEPLIPEAEIIIPEVEVKGGIEVVNAVEDLPAEGKSDMLYKVLADELVYTWNVSTTSYEALTSNTIESKSSLIVVPSFGALPEFGENDVLYKTNDTQLLYLWNNNTNIY